MSIASALRRTGSVYRHPAVLDRHFIGLKRDLAGISCRGSARNVEGAAMIGAFDRRTVLIAIGKLRVAVRTCVGRDINLAIAVIDRERRERSEERRVGKELQDVEIHVVAVSLKKKNSK